ncbi:hypothetical protein E2320_009886 [Naja naja]|nr:hypothetical protein E2320_009886 [Naja naja]
MVVPMKQIGQLPPRAGVMAESSPVNEDAAPSLSQSSGLGPGPRRWERLRLAAGPWARSFGFLAVLGLLYFLRGPLRLRDNLVAVTVFLSTLTPKFYVALTGTSSLISGLIFVSVSHLRPLIGGADNASSAQANFSAASGDNEMNRQNLSECKVWRNPLNLFRGAEYNRYTWVTGKEPLTYYDMNLSAQDHQSFFTCETDSLRPSDAAYILLAEEEATTILEAEKYFKQALRAGETVYKKSQHSSSQNPHHEAQLTMCARKLGRIKEAAKMMRDLMKEFPVLSVLNIHENLLETLLELQAYADVQAVLAKYDDISLPKSAAICYTAALLKARAVSERFSPETASRRGLSTAEINAVEAIHRAVEFNPHVPKYLLEMKSLILPPEHILKRGDSEAVAYAFFHLQHWKRIEGALNLLHCTWEGTFRMIPYPLEKGHLFYPYPSCTETADRELLPTFHDVSVYPQKDLPFFIHFTAGLCSFTAMLALLTHQFPELMVIFAKAFFGTLLSPLSFLMEKIERLMPSGLWHQLTQI